MLACSMILGMILGGGGVPFFHCWFRSCSLSKIVIYSDLEKMFGAIFPDLLVVGVWHCHHQFQDTRENPADKFMKIIRWSVKRGRSVVERPQVRNMHLPEICTRCYVNFTWGLRNRLEFGGMN